MILNDILNEQRIYAMINDVPILRESEVHLFEELIGLYRPTSVLEVGTAIGYSALLMAPLLDEEDGHITPLNWMMCAMKWRNTILTNPIMPIKLHC